MMGDVGQVQHTNFTRWACFGLSLPALALIGCGGAPVVGVVGVVGDAADAAAINDVAAPAVQVQISTTTSHGSTALTAEPVVVDEAPVAPAHDPALLAEILAAQQATSFVSGRLTQTTYRADSLDDEPGVHHVTFALIAPDHYHLCFRPADDDEMADWFIGDGQIQIRAEQIFADEAPEASARRVEPGSDSPMARVAQFFRLGQADLERDFTVTATPLTAASSPAPVVGNAVSRVHLVPLDESSSGQHIRSVSIELDADHRTVAVVLVDTRDNRKVFEVVSADYTSEPDAALFAWPGIDPATVE